MELGAGSISHRDRDVRHQTVRRQTLAWLLARIELMTVSCEPRTGRENHCLSRDVSLGERITDNGFHVRRKIAGSLESGAGSREPGAGSISHRDRDVRHQTVRRQTLAWLLARIELMTVSCEPRTGRENHCLSRDVSLGERITDNGFHVRRKTAGSLEPGSWPIKVYYFRFFMT